MGRPTYHEKSENQDDDYKLIRPPSLEKLKV